MPLLRDYLFSCPECGAKNIATLMLSHFEPGGFTVWSDGYREGAPEVPFVMAAAG